jgi:DNA-binding transcriptional ArsR family regulator
MANVSKDIPLAEITLRKYEKPYGERRDMIKKLCLSIGLLQPGDSRDVVVDVFKVLLDAEKELDCEEVVKKVVESRKEAKLPVHGVAPSNVRRQLRRLRDLYLVEKVKNKYRINEGENIAVLFEEKIEKFYLKSIVARVKEYFNALK